MESKIFKAYDIRGIYPIELNEETARLIAQTFLKILSQQLNKPIKDLKISICRDARQSSEPLMNVVRETFLEYGVAVDDFNLISITGRTMLGLYRL